MTFVTYLLTLIGPLAVRVMISLGFTAVSFAGVVTVFDSLMQIAKDNWSTMPLAVLQLASLSGIPEALGMIFGAYTARVAVWSVMNGTKYLLR
ncbi:MAG: DUF2523 domain-containing protein [Gallionella sp.]|nr:DUF2523 domain-containing protein [Gallionella sp.]